AIVRGHAPIVASDGFTIDTTADVSDEDAVLAVVDALALGVELDDPLAGQELELPMLVSIQLTSAPSNARVYVLDEAETRQFVGVTPVDIELPENESGQTFVLEAEGFAIRTVTVY